MVFDFSLGKKEKKDSSFFSMDAFKGDVIICL